MTDKLTVNAYRCNINGGTQVTIEQTNEEGRGWGRRLAGPKHYNQGTTTLASNGLDADDAREIRGMLAAVFPVTVYALRCGTPGDGSFRGLYANQDAAKAHGVAEYTQGYTASDELTWRHWDEDEAGVLRLFAPDDFAVEGDELIATDWHIVPVTAPAAYEPATSA